MSATAARGLLLRMRADQEFFYRVATIEDADQRLAFIRSQGFECTTEEIAESFDSAFEIPPEVDKKLWKEQLPPNPGFSCEAEWIGDSSAIITVKGELDQATADRLRAVLRDVHARGISNHLAVDLTACTFIDSTGLSVLIEAQQEAKSPLNVASRNEQNSQVLRVTGLDNVFVIHDNREDALAALRKEFGSL